jgi:hypothetical protein
MSFSVKPTPLLIIALCTALAACADLPELEVSEAEFDSDTPYPEFVPVDVLLKEPEATITDDTQDDLDTRREDLLSTPLTDTDDEDDALQERIDALRKRQQEMSKTPSASTQTVEESAEQSIEDRLRDRLENGIRPPTPSE